MVAMSARGCRAIRGFLVAGLLVLFFSIPPALAQNFCVSGGLCFPTIDGAQESLRSDPAKAPVGQFLELRGLTLLATWVGMAQFDFHIHPRVPIAISPALRTLIRPDMDLATFTRAAVAEGLRTLRIAVAENGAQGATTVEEVLKALPPVE